MYQDVEASVDVNEDVREDAEVTRALALSPQGYNLTFQLRCHPDQGQFYLQRTAGRLVKAYS